jgi:hypothetical protein
MVNKIEYHPNHLDLFNTDENKELMKEQTALNDEAITILIDDIPIIATGLRLVNDCTGEIWLVKSKYLEKHAISIIKELKELIEYYVKKYQLTRLQTVIRPQHEKWIKGLGFEKEVEMKGFSKDTVYIYRRIFTWE